ncbi:MAG: phospholipase D family protein [Pseudomonadota bacterium]|nr:phospholipase D family protein [Pseudomonadota bacterium]
MAFVLLMSGCASLPPGSNFPKSSSVAITQPETTALGQRIERAAREHPGYSGFHLLSAGVDGFLARAQMANAAQRTLDLQYFILRGDETGRLLTDAVLRAADRGVRVRVLIDDGETVAGDEQIISLSGHAQIEVRIFNPFIYRGHLKLVRAFEFMLSSARLDYRMHNKLFLADNAVALLGGRNIGDQYFQVDPQSQFADDDVFVAGPIVKELSATFDEYWNSAIAIPAEALAGGESADQSLREGRKPSAQHLEAAPSGEADYSARIAAGEPLDGMLSGKLPLVWAHAQVVCDSPEKKRVEKGGMVGRLMLRPVAQAVEDVRSELLVITPYLIPGQEGMMMFKNLRQRNAGVRVLTNSLESSTVLLAQANYMHYRVPLLETGVELFEVRSLIGDARGSGQSAAMSRYGNYSLHAKIFVFDRKKVFIGSMNFDQRSMHLNTEIGLIIDSPVLAQQMAARFDAMVKPVNAYKVTFQSAAAGGSSSLVWRTQEDANVVEYSSEPARSRTQRFDAYLLMLLPLDSEL